MVASNEITSCHSVLMKQAVCKIAASVEMAAYHAASMRSNKMAASVEMTACHAVPIKQANRKITANVMAAPCRACCSITVSYAGMMKPGDVITS